MDALRSAFCHSMGHISIKLQSATILNLLGDHLSYINLPNNVKISVGMLLYNLRIDRRFEMTSDALTNARKRFASNIASSCYQRYTEDSVF